MIYICKRIKEVIITANSLKEAATRKYGKNIMKTLIKTNELRKVSKSFYNNEQSAKDAAGSFLNDCTIHRLEREKRSVEIIDFEFKKYGFSSMPLFAQYENNNLGLFVKAVFQGLGNQRFTSTNKITEL
jgi:hypothetical protein